MTTRVTLGLLPSGDYGLRVVGPAGALVIIDGASDMFKIQATGTQQLTQAAGSSGDATVTLTALGTFTATPAHLCFESNSSAATSFKLDPDVEMYSLYWVSTLAGGATNVEVVAGPVRSMGYTTLDGSSQCVVYLHVANATGANWTTYQRYYVLQEVAM